jgi:hypothetical protein
MAYYPYLVDVFGNFNDQMFVETVVDGLITYSRRRCAGEISTVATASKNQEMLGKTRVCPVGFLSVSRDPRHGRSDWRDRIESSGAATTGDRTEHP